MKIIILAAGQGTRLRPLTDEKPKCMVEINGRSIIDRQLEVMTRCEVQEKDITIVTGYCSGVLQKHLQHMKINFIKNNEFETTNMVHSLMCARSILEAGEDVIISYGDIVYSEEILKKLINQDKMISVVVDDGWLDYWKIRNENPLEDAETLIYDENDCLQEIGQKTDDISRIQSQYIGLIKFKANGVKDILNICEEARKRSESGRKLWRTNRSYSMMYMTDLLQGLIDENINVNALHIVRGWYEVDCIEDLKIAESELL